MPRTWNAREGPALEILTIPTLLKTQFQSGTNFPAGEAWGMGSFQGKWKPVASGVSMVEPHRLPRVIIDPRELQRAAGCP